MPQSIKECQRCEGTAKSGNQCKNRTCRGKLCWQHLKKRDSLRVKPSGIQGAGMGLFTTKPFKKNEKIVDYTGERMSRAQIRRCLLRRITGWYHFHQAVPAPDALRWDGPHRRPAAVRAHAICPLPGIWIHSTFGLTACGLCGHFD